MEMMISEKIIDVEGKLAVEEIQKILNDMASGIRVKLEKPIVGSRGWVSIKFSGEDSEPYFELIKQKFGFAPFSLDSIEIGDIFRGFIIGVNNMNIQIDFGILSPKPIYGSYRLKKISSQLLDGLENSLDYIIDRFLFHKGVPLEIRIIGVQNHKIDLELSDEYVRFLKQLEKIPFPRIMITAALSRNLINFIKANKIDKYIIGIDRLSLTNHLLTCKIGTDMDKLTFKLSNKFKKTQIHPLKIIRNRKT
ncbi:MAG: DUF2110 family protein [Candidatus Bathyarchaeota archaeon]|nr:DUF2110 family protein [Candidatus Bathyarchaeota archaeon]